MGRGSRSRASSIGLPPHGGSLQRAASARIPRNRGETRGKEGARDGIDRPGVPGWGVVTAPHMKELAALLNDMVARGVVTDYAVFGAVAQMRYTEAVATQDADVLVALPEPDALDLLSRIYAFCEERGYRPGARSWSASMRADIRALLEKQAAWQRSRVARSWNEKLRAMSS